MNIQDFYKYSVFSTLAYVDWRKKSRMGTGVRSCITTFRPPSPLFPRLNSRGRPSKVATSPTHHRTSSLIDLIQLIPLASVVVVTFPLPAILRVIPHALLLTDVLQRFIGGAFGGIRTATA